MYLSFEILAILFFFDDFFVAAGFDSSEKITLFSWENNFASYIVSKKLPNLHAETSSRSWEGGGATFIAGPVIVCIAQNKYYKLNRARGITTRQNTPHLHEAHAK